MNTFYFPATEVHNFHFKLYRQMDIALLLKSGGNVVQLDTVELDPSSSVPPKNLEQADREAQ